MTSADRALDAAQDAWLQLLQDLVADGHIDSDRARTIETVSERAPEWLPTVLTAQLDDLATDYDQAPGQRADWLVAGEPKVQPSLFGPLLIETVAGRSRPPSMLEVFARRGRRYARAVAARLTSSAELQAELEQDAQPASRWALTTRPDAQPGCLGRLATDSSTSVRQSVAAHGRAPQDAVQLLADDPDVGVRATVAARADLDDDLLETLSTDSEPRVRAAAAANQQLPASALELLLDDAVVAVRESAAMHQPLSGDMLYRVATDPAPQVRSTLLMRGDLSPELLATLLIDLATELADKARRWLDQQPGGDDWEYLRRALEMLVLEGPPHGDDEAER